MLFVLYLKEYARLLRCWIIENQKNGDDTVVAYSASVYTDNNRDNRDFSQAIIDIEKFQYRPSL